MTSISGGGDGSLEPLPLNASFESQFAAKTLQDYEVISVIGNGAFGTCFKVRDKESGELYAWKGMDYDELSVEQKESLVSEINVLRQLQHPNIVQYYHHLVNHEAKSLFIVMECCEGGDLAQLITKARAERKRFEEKYIWRVLFQICKAVQVCHTKIRRGTILHRDIKPANIFLDLEGNAKLGDFGLARMLRQNERFAETFVGTPYYMSPEIVKGSKYDRKSDVWSVGCLIYEMCAMRPPFKGREFEQLSANISNGKFSNIPDVYSSDLQEIIAFMLEVENEQRPSIEMITRHPTVVRNISNLGSEFPQLVAVEQDFYVLSDERSRCKLQYSPLTNLSSTRYSEQNSFNEEYGQRRLSGAFTPDLRSELFYSAKRRIFPRSALQQSDPELYETIRRDEYATVGDGKPVAATQHTEHSPNAVTQTIFDEMLQNRLHAIRAQESLLNERECNLNAREQLLNDKETRLLDLEQSLQERMKAFEMRTKQMLLEHNQRMLVPPTIRPAMSTLERSRMPLPEEGKLAAPTPPAPPIPPRKPKKHDDTYCTIEPNDTILQQPTVAKLDLAALPVPKSFPNLRKVTFQSPKKFIKYDIENVQPKSSLKSSQVIPMQSSVSSKASDESSESTQHRRKSILSIFGLNRGTNKESASSSRSSVATTTTTTTTAEQPVAKDRKPFQAKENRQQEVLAKCETSELTNMWTKEHKRAAFDLLAAMKAAEGGGGGGVVGTQAYLQSNNMNTVASRHKFRHSVRERNTLHRNRMRRSLIGPAPQIVL